MIQVSRGTTERGAQACDQMWLPPHRHGLCVSERGRDRPHPQGSHRRVEWRVEARGLLSGQQGLVHTPFKTGCSSGIAGDPQKPAD